MQEAKSFLVSNPTCASAPQLHNKMDEANNKYTKVEQLLQSSQEKYGGSLENRVQVQLSGNNRRHFNNCKTLLLSFRLKNSNQLETSLQNGKTLLSGFENRLAREEVAPADITSLEKTQRELGVRTCFHSWTVTDSFTIFYCRWR